MKKISLGLVSLAAVLTFCISCSSSQVEEKKETQTQKKEQERMQEERASYRGLDRCKNLINISKATTILKDFKTIDDESYTELTMTSSQAWDRESIPQEVLALEAEGYSCRPIPLDIEMPQESKDPQELLNVSSEPVVKRVRWNCELEYEKYKSLNGDALEEKKALEEEGYECMKIDCLDKASEKDSVWFCSK